MLLHRLGPRLSTRLPTPAFRISSPAPLRRTSTWARPSFFTRAPPAYSFAFRRHAFWIIPVAGGLTLYLLPKPESLFPSIFSSPTLIPYPCPTPTPPPLNPTIFSPSESDKTIIARIRQLLREHVWEPILTAKRFVYLFFLFFPVIFTSPMLLVGNPERRLKGDKWGAVWWYGLLVSQMEAAGPTFIKLAQWAASRRDLFPIILCEKLGSLHSQGKPHSLEHTKEVIERVFQRPFEEVFEEFDEVPIGTGAIAQVYRATLKKDLIPPSYLGPRRKPKTRGGALAPVILKNPPPSVPTAAVAIKVLHPNVSKTISRDVSIMQFFARAISILPGMKWISLPEEVQVFGSMMNQQLDLRNEVENLLIFENNFATRKLPVTFPRPLKIWSTHDVLIEEFQNALPMETFLKNGGGPYDDQMATVGLDAFLNMLLLDNFVHADLHPGNIMVKFCKPLNTRMLLENIYNHIFHKQSSNPNNVLALNPADQSDSDKIVSRLRELRYNPAEWHAELERLHEAGYIPEIVFLDAGLVTTLDADRKSVV